jgi:hypothetical protein
MWLKGNIKKAPSSNPNTTRKTNKLTKKCETRVFPGTQTSKQSMYPLYVAMEEGSTKKQKTSGRGCNIRPGGCRDKQQHQKNHTKKTDVDSEEKKHVYCTVPCSNYLSVMVIKILNVSQMW